MKALIDEKMVESVKAKEKLFRSLLVHPKIKAVRSFGLWLAIEFDSFETNKRIIDKCIANGLVTDWFLFAANCLRISPPLIITEDEIRKAAKILLDSI